LETLALFAECNHSPDLAGLQRIYRDALGRANQKLAAAATESLFLVAGMPLPLK
jgi:adenosyl cobinamide kinase/adenosyl cobinamide phosphate guanylyltransferase